MSSQPAQQGSTVKNYSAFKLDLWKPSVPYYIELISPLYPMFSTMLHFKPKIYQTLDIFSLFYFPPDQLTDNLKQPIRTFWQRLIQSVLSSPEYVKLNKLTQGSIPLALMATYQFFERLKANLRHEDVQKDLSSDKKQALAAELLGNKIIHDVLHLIASDINDYIKERDMAETAIEYILGAGGQGFTHDALSIWSFLERPGAFTARVRMLRQLMMAMKYFYETSANNVNKELVESTYGGVSGVGLFRDMKQIIDVMPYEWAMPKELIAARMLSNSLIVKARAANRRIAVFVDKSGSMADPISLNDGGYGVVDSTFGTVAKISVAAGLALVLYRRFNADVYLFDVEVDKVSPREIVKTLLTIKADSGTNITNVLAEVEKLPKNVLSIIISDGIDDVDSSYARRIAANHNVAVIVLPPSGDYDWLRYFRVVRPRSLKDFLAPLM